MNKVQEDYNSFISRVFPPNLPRNMELDLRKTFVAGYLLCFKYITIDITNMEDEEGEKALRQLHLDIKEFAATAIQNPESRKQFEEELKKGSNLPS